MAFFCWVANYASANKRDWSVSKFREDEIGVIFHGTI